MVVHINNLSLKTAILTITLLLALTSVSAHEWAEPNDGALYNSPTNLTLNPDGVPENVEFEVNYPGESADNRTSSIDGDNHYFELGDSAPSGVYEVRAYVEYSSATNSSERIEFTLDNSRPNIESYSIEGLSYVNSDDMSDLEFEVSDSDSGVDSVRLSLEEDGEEVVEDDKDCSESCSFDLTDDLDHGTEYNLDIEVEDEAGNIRDESEDFTYDDVYEGDESPDINPEPQVFKTPTNKDEYTFDIYLDSETEDSEITVECELGSDVFDAGRQEVDEDNTEYSCDVEPWYDATADLTIRMIDEAGNSVEQDFEYTFDTRDPEIENLSTVVSIFNDDFDVNYDSYDTASEVVNATYRLDNDILTTDQVQNADGSVTVDTEGLESGSHDVYLWVQDEAGRWSDTAGPVTFEYRPDASPEASMSVNDSIEVTAGNFASVNVEVKNTGELYIPRLSIGAESDFFNGSSETADIKPNSSEEAEFTIGTTEEDLGVHSVTFSSTSPDLSSSTQIVVRANEDQKDNISSRYEEVSEKFEGLQSNISSLMQKLSDERKEELRSEFSDFNKSITRAENAYENEKYYKVSSEIEDFDSRFESSKSAYKEVQKEHSVTQRNKMITLFLLAFISLGGAGLGYTYFSEDYELDVEALKDFEPSLDLQGYELSLEPLMAIPERIGAYAGNLLEEEEEEMEQAFTGFT